MAAKLQQKIQNHARQMKQICPAKKESPKSTFHLSLFQDAAVHHFLVADESRSRTPLSYPTTMILDISPVIQRIRETDFAMASTAKARAVYGILLSPEAEATALLTIYCGMNTSPCDHQIICDLEYDRNLSPVTFWN